MIKKLYVSSDIDWDQIQTVKLKKFIWNLGFLYWQTLSVMVCDDWISCFCLFEFALPGNEFRENEDLIVSLLVYWGDG